MGNDNGPDSRPLNDTEVQPPVAEPGGLGGAFAPDERHERALNRLVERALRWQTEKTAGDLSKLSPKDLTAREIAVAVTLRNMNHRDGRVSNGAVKNLIAMEAQNQKDQQPVKGAEGTEAGDVHLHLHDEQHLHVRERTATELVSRLRRVASRAGEDGGAGPEGLGGDRAAD